MTVSERNNDIAADMLEKGFREAGGFECMLHQYIFYSKC